MINVIIDHILKCVSGEYGLTANLVFDPINHIRLRPNVIYDIVENKKVLHLGCTDHSSIIEWKVKNGRYLHRQLTYVTQECLGVDINAAAAEQLKTYGIDNIIINDITIPGIKEISENSWDYLLMAEMLEHVDNPVDFLKSIIKAYGKNIDHVIITVPNAFGLVHLVNVIGKGLESVNYDHKYWFTPYTACKVIHESGLILEDLIMCLYENSTPVLKDNIEELKQKPILLDTIVIIARLP